MRRMPAIPLAISRRTEVLRLVLERGSVSVPELVALLHVSPDTVRRDLDSLAEAGALTRTHGGAVRPEDAPRLTPMADRVTRHTDAKTRIGLAAARLIESGETLIVNGGSTTLAFAKMLPSDRSVSLVTNSISIIGEVDAGGFTNVHVLGGAVSSLSNVIIGPVAVPHADRVAIDTAVIGVRSINAVRGIATGTVGEALMIAEMIRIARRTIVVADSSKFQQKAFATIASLREIDVLVTDELPPTGLAENLAKAEVRVVVAA